VIVYRGENHLSATFVETLTKIGGGPASPAPHLDTVRRHVDEGHGPRPKSAILCQIRSLGRALERIRGIVVTVPLRRTTVYTPG
jgi:hypothetical protein